MNLNSENMPLISVVIPVYNEEPNIKPFLSRLEPVIEKIGNYEILFCVDPSTDGTEEVIENEIKRNSSIRMIIASRRFSQAAATMAGIAECRGANCVVIDVDLQDPPELIADLYKKMQEGYDVVCAKRRSRKGETFLKLFINFFAYRIINKITDIRIPKDTGDFRIMTRRVIEELCKLKEVNGFFRGLVSFVGFKQAYVEYDRDARAGGDGKYNRLTGSIKVGVNGLICFSTFPLSLISIIAFIILTISGGSLLLLMYQHLVLSKELAGGLVIGISIIFVGGIQLLSLGIVGEYIGRIYEEVRCRPQYIIDRKVNF